ncbi:hypothetical protein Poli38472_013846 [Pythium oligandrum]|uniref:Protein kinase domain-containing protein n=1 Tax=Pythium oligandrum TaxID=41045 RepID=A0A8K1C286_PYTOL|nr:hypothetical protein Poli38472_013846 [Pythium oligandrum]|eukprot:TMW55084.1 hypothetical protein Poli38472_013846 [Pythium oligandrum]
MTTRCALWLVPFTLLALFYTVVAQDTCPDVELPVPEAVTVSVSPTSKSEAIVLHPDCTYETLTTTPNAYDPSSTDFNASYANIVNIESLPAANRVLLIANHLQPIDFSKDTTVTDLLIGWNALTSIDEFKFPRQLRGLDVEGNSLSKISEGTIPAGVSFLYLTANKLKTLANIAMPASLKYLYLMNNQFSKLELPDGILGAFLDGNPLTTMDNVTLPSSLENLTCVNCGLTTIRGVEFPSSLLQFKLTQNKVSKFEIRESDKAVFQKIMVEEGTIVQTECEDEKAEQVTLDSGAVLCVISDEHFNVKYRGATPSADDSKLTIGPGKKNTTSSDTEDSSASTAKDTNAANVASANTSSSGSTTTIVIVVVVCAALAVAGFVAHRKYAAKKNGRDMDDTTLKYHRGDDTTKNTWQGTGNGFGTGNTMGFSGSAMSQEYLSNDVRNDEELIPFRIAQDEIQITKMLAKGGFGVIHTATYRGREVAVKQLLQDKSRNHSAIKSFMDEIRMCSKLDHPKVVEFVGIAWSNLLDIAVVIEYMAGGDLTTALHALPGANPRDWYEASAALKPKSLVALDTIEALVYLHSFESPVIHRDLKARNVLLTADGEAKLSDFGISREMSLDETMTGEIGTVAWIAPEVLQGERYSEKADIYSFGVLLVEMDTCRHPYSKDVDTDDGSQLSSSHTNTRIAMMVSAGVLKPSASRDAPRDLKELIARCVCYEPNDRPTAVEIHFELRKILESRSLAT